VDGHLYWNKKYYGEITQADSIAIDNKKLYKNGRLIRGENITIEERILFCGSQRFSTGELGDYIVKVASGSNMCVLDSSIDGKDEIYEYRVNSTFVEIISGVLIVNDKKIVKVLPSDEIIIEENVVYINGRKMN